MTKTEKCIIKWEKRLVKANRWKEKYGAGYWMNPAEQIRGIEEIIKDLKRLKPPGKLQKTLINSGE